MTAFNNPAKHKKINLPDSFHQKNTETELSAQCRVTFTSILEYNKVGCYVA